jgi:hypothetical protein
MTPIKQANDSYERWLRAQLKGDIVERDLREKREKMVDGPFPFLRATFWRWAETILDICPELATSPRCLAVGDIHLENFGTWRDGDGRLVWGVNDYDEAAELPYSLDLVRLATSAFLALPSRAAKRKAICAAILKGYREGLKDPRPFVLDQNHAWLSDRFAVSEEDRVHFWKKIDKLKPSTKKPARRYRRIIAKAMPDRKLAITHRPRRAGTGSLGRPRWVGIAEWRGGRVVREAKALAMSAWNRVHAPRSQRLRCKEVALGRHRAPDAWYDVIDATVVRRLSPSSRKIEITKQPDELLDTPILHAMGHELASIHLGTGNRRAAIARDLAKRRSGWLLKASDAAAKFVIADYGEWVQAARSDQGAGQVLRQRLAGGADRIRPMKQ